MDTISKERILRFALDFTLCDHIGDVGNNIDKLLKEIGIDEDWYEQGELNEILRAKGVKYSHEIKEDK